MDQELQLLQNFYTVLVEFFTEYSFQLIGAIIVFFDWFIGCQKSRQGFMQFLPA